MTAVAKETAEREAVLEADSAEKKYKNDGSGETKEVNLTTVSKATAKT